jgi:hypothetical protein
VDLLKSLAKASCYLDFQEESIVWQTPEPGNTLVGMSYGCCGRERGAIAVSWYLWSGAGMKMLANQVSTIGLCQDANSFALLKAMQILIEQTCRHHARRSAVA